MNPYIQQLSQFLDFEHPIVQAPLPYELLPASFTAQFSQLGALGMIRLPPCYSVNELKSLCQNMTGSYAVCFTHVLPNSNDDARNNEVQPILWLNILRNLIKDAPIRHDIAPRSLASFEEHLQTCLEMNVPMLGFQFGLPSDEVIAELKNAERKLFAICSNLPEALAAEAAGMDFIVLHGNDAGGEFSCFSNSLMLPRFPSFSLLQQCREDIDIPLILWGDFSSSATIAAALNMGAQGVMLDRGLLCCQESALHDKARRVIQESTEMDSCISETYGKAPMRLLKNRISVSELTLVPSLQREMYLRSIVAQALEQDVVDLIPISLSLSPAYHHYCLEDYINLLCQSILSYFD